MKIAVAIMETTKLNDLSLAIDIGILDISKAEFYHSSGGFTGLRYGDEDYKRVSLRRVLPVGKPLDFISVADVENKEIGILRSIEELSSEQSQLVLEELDRRYYCPNVKEIKSIHDKLGYVYMELCLGEYTKSCAVKDVNKNIRLLDDDQLIIFDVDGNRYIVPSLSKLNKKSLRRLEPYMF